MQKFDTTEMRILLTNDDGYKSKGIHELVDIMRPYGEITVVAPKYHQSGMSMSASLGFKPLAYKHLGEMDGADWHYLDATPASCTKFAIDNILGCKPDVCISGINHGSNSATALWYSATVGAARQASLYGVPAFAVSLDNVMPDADFSEVRKRFPAIFEKLYANVSNREILYNINFPNTPIKGIRVCTQGLVHWKEEFIPYDRGIYGKLGVTPEDLGVLSIPEPEPGETVYMMAGKVFNDPRNGNGTDFIANSEGYISVSAHGIYDYDAAETERISGIL